MHDAVRHTLFAWIVLAVAGVATLYPIVWMFVISFKTGPDLLGTGLLEFGALGIGNYVTALAARPFFLYLLNSVLAAGVSVVVSIVVGGLAGYSFAKYRFLGVGLLWLICLAAIMIPLEAIVIPLFLQVNAFGWTNSYAGLLLPTAFNVVAVFIFRQAMMAIPDDLIEAARVDGASEPRILFSVIMPLIRPNIIVVAILTFNLNWNSYLWPLVVVSDDALRTLPLGMAAFQGSLNTEYGQLMAVSVFGSIPTLLFFIVLQRHFLESVVATGIKG